MIQYGNDANKANGLQLFNYLFEDHRGPQLITDMIREYKAHQSTKLCLSYCIETVYYTITMIEYLQNGGNALKIKKKKKQRKKRQSRATANIEENVERAPEEEDEEKANVEIAGMEIHDSDLEEEEDDMIFVEKNFDFDQFLKGYAANKVMLVFVI